MFILQGWYIVSYALAIYLLNLFIAFISPKFDPIMEEEEEIGKTLIHLCDTSVRDVENERYDTCG